MSSSPPAPPLSVRGFYDSLRWPTAADVALSMKAYLAVVLALLVGFSQGLVNPYWSALTIYIVLSPPESAALRSKALFRLIGTVAGGTLILVETALFGDQLGILATAVIVTIVLATFLRGIDRTPANYMYFSAGLTAGVIGLVNLMQPEQIFVFATARIAEIMVGILAIAAVDSLIWPRPMTPQFLATIEDWRGTARDWVTHALSRIDCQPPDEAQRRATREQLRKLTGTVSAIDAQAVQLPYDIVARPPRPRDLNLVRHAIVHLVVDLSSIEVWTRALRRIEYKGAGLDDMVRAVAAWVGQGDAPPGAADTDHVAAADQLLDRIAAARTALGEGTDRDTLAERGMLTRLGSFTRDWRDLELALGAVRANAALPPHLLARVRLAKPVRSVDFLAVARDVLPMALAMGFTTVLWYLTAWSAGNGALLFAFIGCAFLIGQPGILRSAGGMLLWIGTAFAFVFFYQFVVLPRVTAFPVLIAVLGVAMIPLGIVLTMNTAGLLICVFTFASLGLENAYTADFQQSLLTVSGAMAGLLIAGASLYLCAYDRPRFVARRLIRGVRLDVADIGDARRLPDRERFMGLTIDRLGQFFPAIAGLAPGDPLTRVDMIDELRIGLNLLELRAAEASVGAGTRAMLVGLRTRLAAALRVQAQAPGTRLPTALYDDLGDATAALATMMDEPRQAHIMEALVGLRLALAPDASPVGQAVIDEAGTGRA